MGPRCFKCLMFSPSGPVELVFLVDLRAAEVCAIVIFMGVVLFFIFMCVCHYLHWNNTHKAFRMLDFLSTKQFQIVVNCFF